MSGARNAQAIAVRNDRFRGALCRRLEAPGDLPGRLVLTSGVARLQPDLLYKVLARVACFQDFTEANDPYCEHDFGSFDLEGIGSLFWKIDRYADACCRLGSDNADGARSHRVLTIMLADEY